MPVKGCLDQANWGGKILLNLAIPLHGLGSWISEEEKPEILNWAPAFMTLCFLTVTAVWPVASHSCCHDFAPDGLWILKLWAKQTLPPLSVRHFVPAMREVKNFNFCNVMGHVTLYKTWEGVALHLNSNPNKEDIGQEPCVFKNVGGGLHASKLQHRERSNSDF